MIPVTTFSGKTVAVFGLGGSGLATARALLAGGAQVAAWDDGAAGRAAAETAGIPLEDLSAADWGQFAALVLAPGVPLTHPEPHWTVTRAKAAGIEIIGDIELFCRERNAYRASESAKDGHGPDAPFIAVTGTNGKSTTTALIAHILREAGCDVQMGGNIGVPVLALEPPAPNRFHVIEMSSFQIDLTPSVNPTIGVLLNITPDHLDRHGTMANYAGVKARLIAGCKQAVVGTQSIPVITELEHIAWNPALLEPIATGTLISSSEMAHVTWSDGVLRRHREAGIAADLRDVATLRGPHNGENAAAAFAVAARLGLDAPAIARHMRTYPGLPHRLEEIGRVGDVLFINDSKATNADSTEKALLSFPRNVFWIVGGKPKEGGIESLRPYFPGVVRAYLIGAASDDFARTLDGDVAMVPCGTLEVAVARAASDAAAYACSSPGPIEKGAQLSTVSATPTPALPTRGRGKNADSPPPCGEGLGVGVARRKPVVLLSPACASYDQFKSFEHRGEAFRALVTALPGFVPRVKP